VTEYIIIEILENSTVPNDAEKSQIQKGNDNIWLNNPIHNIRVRELMRFSGPNYVIFFIITMLVDMF
jgi:hypothetical protein